MRQRYRLIPLLVFILAFAACRTSADITPDTVQDTIAVPATAPGNAEIPSPVPKPTTLPATTSTETPVPYEPRFEPADCQFSPSHISNISCGYVTVPENRGVTDGREIRLHVAIASSYADPPEEDPLIFLSGGPGSNALEWLYYHLRNYTDILRKRDVIFFDPRGIGFSEPSLDCPEVMDSFTKMLDLPQGEGELVDELVTANLACRDRLNDAGVDLLAYNSAEMAADVNDIRLSLEYDMINLLGISYGTRTALTLMRDYPEILRSVVLDSPVPLEAEILGADAVNSDQARRLLFERCEADTYCSAAYPDLEVAFDELYDQLEANPITIPVTHLGTNETHRVWVDGSILGASVVEALYNSETIVYLPKLIYDTLESEDGSYETLATSLEIYLFYGDYSSEAMRHSVLCSDESVFSTLDSGLALAENAHPAITAFIKKDVEMIYRICEAWEVDTADPIENEPVLSDIPTLVLSGEFDPVTPPSWGMQVADNLSNSFFVQFPNLGHYVFAERSCARDIIADFLEDPVLEPDSSCTNFITLNFVTY